MKILGKFRGSLLLVLAVLAALNVAAGLYFGRLDLSGGRIFTLSDYSRGLVAGLKEPVTVKVFFSEDVGPQYNQNRTYLRDMLEDYKAFSKGRLTVELVNPREKESFEAEAKKYRIQALQAQVLENDQFTSRMVFMGLAFLAGDRTETIPVLTEVDGLEYTITSTLRRLTVQELETVGILQGHGEPPLAASTYPGMPQEGPALGLLTELLRKDYQVRPLNLSQVPAVPQEIGTLLCVKPTATVDTASLYKLDQFLMRGGRLGLFLDKVDARLQEQQALPLQLGLDAWLAHFGVRVVDNLVGDLSCGSVQVRQGGGGGWASLFPITMKYPLFVEVKDFAAGQAISRDLSTATLFYPSSLDTAAFAAARAMGAKAAVIARSTPSSEVQGGPSFDLAPLEQADRQTLAARFGAGPQVLAATVEGPFRSAFAGPPVPDTTGAAAVHLSQSAGSRLAVVGDGDFLIDGFARPNNVVLAQNIVDWLSLDDGLISIRGKSIAARPLEDVSDAARKWLKWLNILGVPALVVAFGLLRWSTRRRRSQAA